MTGPTERPWTVVYYRDRSGHYPVADFLSGLSAGARAVVLRDFDLLEEFGLAVGLPTVRKIAGVDKLWELRAKTTGGAVRLFYVAQTGRHLVMLHGFVKKSARTPRRELDVAVRRLREVLAEKE